MLIIRRYFYRYEAPHTTLRKKNEVFFSLVVWDLVNKTYISDLFIRGRTQVHRHRQLKPCGRVRSVRASLPALLLTRLSILSPSCFKYISTISAMRTIWVWTTRVGEAHALIQCAVAHWIVCPAGHRERSEPIRQRQAHRGDTKKRGAPKRDTQ